MFTDYLYVLVFMGSGIFLVAAALTISRFLRPSNPAGEKSSTYECGEVPIGGAWVQFNVRYYIYALLFVIFDVGAVLLIPWAVSFRSMEPSMMAASLILASVFIAVLGVALAYAWRKGMLKWQ
ncbi:MAG: NADH-quinone oxidoreductase subunit A [Candidatus Xenobiia bacterium LiM19]